MKRDVVIWVYGMLTLLTLSLQVDLDVPGGRDTDVDL